MGARRPNLLGRARSTPCMRPILPDRDAPARRNSPVWRFGASVCSACRAKEARRPVSAPSIGSQLGSYRIETLLGRGGMGVVYRAEDVRLGRKVALKLLPSDLTEDPGFRARFLAESRLAASIDHAGIVPIYEAGEIDGQLYIAMRYVEGTDLGSLLRREGPMQPRRAVELVAQLGQALDAAHARGLVHRDVKPGNALIAQEGSD